LGRLLRPRRRLLVVVAGHVHVADGDIDLENLPPCHPLDHGDHVAADRPTCTETPWPAVGIVPGLLQYQATNSELVAPKPLSRPHRVRPW